MASSSSSTQDVTDEPDVLPSELQGLSNDSNTVRLRQSSTSLHSSKSLERILQLKLEPKPGAAGRGVIDSPSSPATPLRFSDDEPGDEDPPEPKSFERWHSPSAMQRNRSAEYAKVGDQDIHKMHRFSLYETATRFYLIGADVTDKQFRVLKIDRTAPPEKLEVIEDDIVYDKREMNQLLNAIDDGNKASGGLRLTCKTWGILGFIRFTEAHYMLVITKRQQAAMIGGHFIYQIEATELIPITTGSSSRFQRDRNPEETRYLGILANLDLNHHFYFSYSYNITHTLQKNIIRERTALNAGRTIVHTDFNDMFVWNHHLLQPLLRPAREEDESDEGNEDEEREPLLRNTYDWCLPIIHGFIDQSPIDVFGRKLYLTVIARRSRFYAGARFLKRGANDLGYVANDVETEQILSDLVTTSFHAPGPQLFASPTYTSYVQHRGSIPLFWTQDSTGVNPKPEIKITLEDPFYSATALHFNDLFQRYGAPVYILNLVKARERTPRESKLLHAYRGAIDYLNQSLPENDKILYRAFDMSRASKTRGQDVIGTLELIAEDVLGTTGFFHNGSGTEEISQTQNGVARTNCIDCLDRTNAAQFVVGKRALGRQFHALGVIPGNTVEYDSDAADIFTRMWHMHGDTIAIQYGGSHLVNTMATYRKTNQWQSSSRDLMESFKRYYHNSFLDSQRQEAYNLFLGNYVHTEGQPMLWDLQSDHYLHHNGRRDWSDQGRRNYIQWYDPENLEKRELPGIVTPSKYLPDHRNTPSRPVEAFDDYWLEYYRPWVLSSFAKVFSFRKNNLQPHMVDKHHRHPPGYDLSPFVPRKKAHELDSPGKKALRKGVTIVAPKAGQQSPEVKAQRSSRLAHPGEVEPLSQSILRESSQALSEQTTMPSMETSGSLKDAGAADKSKIAHWTFNQFYNNSLNPSVTPEEAYEYERYVSHPLSVPLIFSTREMEPEDSSYLDFLEYLNIAGAGIDERVGDEDFADFAEFLEVSDDALTVMDDDGSKKRYKAYRQWLRGRSLFKQNKVESNFGGEIEAAM